MHLRVNGMNKELFPNQKKKCQGFKNSFSLTLLVKHCMGKPFVKHKG